MVLSFNIELIEIAYYINSKYKFIAGNKRDNIRLQWQGVAIIFYNNIKALYINDYTPFSTLGSFLLNNKTRPAELSRLLNKIKLSLIIELVKDIVYYLSILLVKRIDS